VKKLHDIYGPAVRFTPNDVSYITPTAWHTIYGHKKTGQLTFQKDKRLYRSSLTAADNILLANDVDHSRQRRLLSHAFSEKALRSQEHILNSYLNLLISKLAMEAEPGRVANMVQWYNFTTFDIIGDLAFGEPFGCLEGGVYHPWVAKLFDGFRLAVFNQAIRRLPIAAPLLRQFIPRKLIASQIDHLRLSFEKAKKRLESGKTDRDDFMTYILRYNDEKGMTVDEIGENANILILAGSETTATLLSGTTFWLLRNPKIYRTLVQEIRSAFTKEEEINSISVNNLKYLLAVLNEGLRIYPPSPGGLGRISPPGGSTVDGYWMPEGVSKEFRLSFILMTDAIQTVVSVPHWASYHSSRNFAYPDDFIPERWLSDPRFDHDIKEVLQPFQFGPRNCLGKKYDLDLLRSS
jgi:cytochrome P450